MGVSDGQSVNAAVTNAAFLDSTVDDTATGVLTLDNADAASGASVTNIQREHNSIAAYIGKALNAVFDSTPTWTANEGFVSANDTVTVRVEAISEKFDKDTGHTHDGTAGEGGVIAATSLSGLFGAIVQVDDSEGAPAAITVGGGISFSSTRVITAKFIVGDAAPIDITANPQIAAGSSVGQILVLIGTDDTDYVLLEDGTGLGSNGPCELGDGKVWAAMWSGSVWQEIFRSH